MFRPTALVTVLLSVALLAGSCGSDSKDTLTDLGLSESEAACFTREYEDRGLDIDRMLSAENADDFTAEEQAAVIEVAARCAEGAASDDTGDDSSTDGDTGSDTGDSPSYDDLGFLERAFVDGMTESGVGMDAALCIIGEFDDAGVSIADLAELGANDDAEPPADLMQAFFRCGDELADSGVFEGDFFGRGLFDSGSTGNAYGDDPELDRLWDACADGDGEACDDLYWTSPVDSEYEAFGDTCGERFTEGAASCALALGDTVASGSYGDDPGLDALWDACAAGDLTACDDLYWQSPVDSAYEDFGRTCGDTSAPNAGGCAGTTDDVVFGYGDDPRLDTLWDGCTAGDLVSCDDLYWTSPIDSLYEEFGSTCGDTSQPSSGQCSGGGGTDPTTDAAQNYGDDPVLDALWDSCSAGDDIACDDLYWQSPIGSLYEWYGSTCGTRSVADEKTGSCAVAG